eukprot:SAG11_NODE_9398_length_916_cov_0.984088_1_plen_95_part_00
MQQTPEDVVDGDAGEAAVDLTTSYEFDEDALTAEELEDKKSFANGEPSCATRQLVQPSEKFALVLVAQFTNSKSLHAKHHCCHALVRQESSFSP